MKPNPCKTCITLAMCIIRVRKTYEETDFDRKASKDLINRSILTLALKPHCSIFRDIARIPEHEKDPKYPNQLYDSKRIVHLAKTLGL